MRRGTRARRVHKADVSHPSWFTRHEFLYRRHLSRDLFVCLNKLVGLFTDVNNLFTRTESCRHYDK